MECETVHFVLYIFVVLPIKDILKIRRFLRFFGDGFVFEILSTSLIYVDVTAQIIQKTELQIIFTSNTKHFSENVWSCIQINCFAHEVFNSMGRVHKSFTQIKQLRCKKSPRNK